MSKKTIIWFSILFSIIFMFSTGIMELRTYGSRFLRVEELESFVCITSIIGFSTILYFLISFINTHIKENKPDDDNYDVKEDNSDDLILTDEEKRLWEFIKETYGKTDFTKNEFFEYYRKRK